MYAIRSYYDQRSDRLARVLGLERRRAVLRRRRLASRAHPAPEVELPVDEDAAALHSTRIAAQLPAAARHGGDLWVERRARKLDVGCGLLDPRRGDPQVGVVRES